MGDGMFHIPQKIIWGALVSLVAAAAIPTGTLLISMGAARVDFEALKSGQHEQAAKLDNISSAIGDMREGLGRHDERIKTLEGKIGK